MESFKDIDDRIAALELEIEECQAIIAPAPPGLMLPQVSAARGRLMEAQKKLATVLNERMRELNRIADLKQSERRQRSIEREFGS
jgi:hypothetical protein